MKSKAIWLSYLVFVTVLCVPVSASEVWLRVPYDQEVLISSQNGSVVTAPLHGTLENRNVGWVYIPDDEFWGIRNDTLVLHEIAGETTYRLYGEGYEPLEATGFELLESSAWLSTGGPAGAVNTTETAAIVGDKGAEVSGWGWLSFDPTAFAASQNGASGELGGQTATVANAMICPPPTLAPITEDPVIIEGLANGDSQFTISLVEGRTLQASAGGQTADGPSLDGEAARISMIWNSHGRLTIVVNDQTLLHVAIANSQIDDLRIGVLDETLGWGLFVDELFVGDFSTEEAASIAQFGDDFDSLSTAAWPAVEATGVQARSLAALVGSGGLEVHPGLSGETDTYVIDTGLQAEDALGVRLLLDPNDVGIAVGEGFDILAGSDSDVPATGEDHLRLHLRRGNFGYLVKIVVKNDSGAVGSPWVALSGEPQTLELQWRAADSLWGDGYAYLWIDGVLEESLTGLTNQTRTIESVRIGAIGADSAYTGWLILDEYQAWSPVEVLSGS